MRRPVNQISVYQPAHRNSICNQLLDILQTRRYPTSDEEISQSEWGAIYDVGGHLAQSPPYFARFFEEAGEPDYPLDPLPVQSLATTIKIFPSIGIKTLELVDPASATATTATQEMPVEPSIDRTRIIVGTNVGESDERTEDNLYVYDINPDTTPQSTSHHVIDSSSPDFEISENGLSRHLKDASTLIQLPPALTGPRAD